ncbi:hypothetical protein CCH79_00008041 [Gambusia affinis]|uniref:Uncharacterized protein n=1 Tax=Gambusia affinis TaxID=33528 RepID=A0A315WCU3_GAMAF|nr:hypothetical protein CCH79_00008041 [Gambusia affinis]
MPEQSNDYRVVVFGAGGVGKSSLVLRFVKGTFRDTYIPTILAIKSNVEAIPIMLVGNKSDETHREVETKDGEDQANRWKCAFMETSAKTNHNVTELFQELLNLDKKRNMSLNIDGKHSGKQSRAERLKGKCSVM